MDIEAALRRELIDALTPDFACFEEVALRPALFPERRVRADVVAVPLDQEFFGHALAFEVKRVGQKNDCTYWSTAIRQAQDYVYAHLDSDHHLLSGRRISAALVYPAPRYYVYPPRFNCPDDISEKLMISGAFLSAMHSRVGRAMKDESSRFKDLHLYMGPNFFWSEKLKFTGQAKAVLKNRRRLGSQHVDVIQELGGLGDAIAYPDFG